MEIPLKKKKFPKDDETAFVQANFLENSTSFFHPFPLSATSIEKVPKISASGKNFL